MLKRLLVLVAVLALPAVVGAQSADNVLLVVNETSAASVQIGEYYSTKRAIAADHIVRLKTAVTETIQRPDYERTIEGPIANWLTVNALQDRVLYVVLTKGVPIRIAGTGGRDGTVASVDSELTLLYRKLLGQPSPILGRVSNPYFLDTKPLTAAQVLTRVNAEIYLVTRLDGFTVDDVLRLIERGSSPSTTGKIVLDQRGTLFDSGGDRWLQEAADRLTSGSAGDRIALETSKALSAVTDPAIGYYSWGSNDPANRLRRVGLAFSPGAIGGMFVSTDGRTFAEPPADWTPSGPNGGPTFGGSFQSLAGDLIRDGITGVAGHVDEPFLDATIRPQILFPAYLAGFNLAESFYLAMPFLSWQTVVIGDPLCTPFPRQVLAPDAIAKGVDSESDMPVIFTGRRLAILGSALNPAAVKMSLKLEVEVAKGDLTSFESRLIRATELEPKFANAHLALASYYGQRADYDRAIERFQRVVQITPDNAVALNDLAYMLAEQKHQPKDALPFAERAFRLSPQPAVLDTLGWVQHLLGEDDRGIGYLERALTGAPNNVEILIHAAIMHTALNSKIRARSELQHALKLDPKIADRADVKGLQAALR